MPYIIEGTVLDWTEIADLTCLFYPTVGAANVQGQLYAFGVTTCGYQMGGGLAAATYDPVRNRWTLRSGRSVQVCCWTNLSGAYVNGGDFYALARGTDGTPITLSYDPSRDTWTAHTPAPTADRGRLSAVGGSDGRLYAFDNLNDSGSTGLVEIYDPGQDRWIQGATMPRPVASGAVVATGDAKVYAFGDHVGELYDIAHNTWTTFPTSVSIAEAGGVQAPSGTIYIVGAPIQFGPLVPTPVYSFDPTTNKWMGESALDAGELTRPNLATVGSVLYVVGGYAAIGWSQRVWRSPIPD